MASQRVDAAQGQPAALRRGGQLLGLRELTLVPVIVLVIVIGAFASDAFLTTDNLLNILQQSSELSVVVIAETLILLAGKFDLSLESVVGLAPMLGAWLIIKNVDVGGSGVGLAWWLAIPVVLLTGAVVGAINGFLIVRLRLNAFIVTLAMLIALRGLQLAIVGGATISNLANRLPTIDYLGSLRFLTLPLSIWIVIICFGVGIVVLGYTRVGRSLYAVGGNAAAARAAGIRVERVVWITLIVAGMLAAFAGLMHTPRLGSVAANQGNGMIFTVFAAAVIGGISLDGGKGSLFGALTGVILLGLIQNVLTLAQVKADQIQAVNGLVILVALVLARLTSGKAQD